MKTTETEILSAGEQGPSGPTTAAALLTAVQAMNAEQLTAYLQALNHVNAGFQFVLNGDDRIDLALLDQGTNTYRRVRLVNGAFTVVS